MNELRISVDYYILFFSIDYSMHTQRRVCRFEPVLGRRRFGGSSGISKDELSWTRFANDIENHGSKSKSPFVVYMVQTRGVPKSWSTETWSTFRLSNGIVRLIYRMIQLNNETLSLIICIIRLINTIIQLIDTIIRCITFSEDTYGLFMNNLLE